MILPHRHSLYLKPGLSWNCVAAVALCLPISSIIWAGVIYGATRLVR